MKKLFGLFLVALLALGLATSVRAENSGSAYDGTQNPMQVMVMLYNNSGILITSNSVVCLDYPSALSNATGAYATFAAATAAVNVAGVADEDIATQANEFFQGKLNAYGEQQQQRARMGQIFNLCRILRNQIEPTLADHSAGQ